MPGLQETGTRPRKQGWPLLELYCETLKAEASQEVRI